MFRFFSAWVARLPPDLCFEHVAPADEWYLKCELAMYNLELRRTAKRQVANLVESKKAFLLETYAQVGVDRGNLWRDVAGLRRGTGRKDGGSFGRPTAVLLNNDGCVIETAEGIRHQWTSHFAAVEGGQVVNVAELSTGSLRLRISKML